MRYRRTVTTLSLQVVLLATLATLAGILSDEGPGPYNYETIRGDTVVIYGTGVYRHMSAALAPQGIAQDYVTLFVGIPLLLVSLFYARKGSVKGRFLLAGTLGYFLVTYLFYLVMSMYNILFLAYVLLLSFSFFGFSLTLFSFDTNRLPGLFTPSTPVKATGGFLIFNSIAIGLMWLNIVVPPLLDGTVIPAQAEHYTTLIVQGLDLSLLLPLSFISGLLFMLNKPMGYLMAPVYFVFLSILMIALTAKVIAIGMVGDPVIPAIFIIPLFGIISITCMILIFKNIKEPLYETH